MTTTIETMEELDLQLMDMANEQTSSHRISQILKKQKTRKAIRERIKGLGIVILMFGLMAITPKDIDGSPLVLLTMMGGYKMVTGK